MTFRDAFVGMELPPLGIDPITRRTLALFAGASGNYQPTHIDIDAAKAKGYDDVLAHGMLLMAFLGRLLTDWVPQERVKSFSARFMSRVPVHAEPTCRGTVTALQDGLATVELSLVLGDGDTVLRGEATVDLR